MNRLSSLALTGAIMLSSPFARSEVIVLYSNFGQNMAYDTNPYHAWTINGYGSSPPAGGQQVISNQFTPSSTENFLSAQVGLSAWSAGSINVVLQEDNNGLPGAIIETIPITLTSYTAAIYEAVSVLVPTLQAGTRYWLTVVAAGSESVIAGWQWNSIADIGTSNTAGNQDGSPLGLWGINPYPVTRGVFQINGGVTINRPTTKDQCKNSGWQTYGFKNQGQCVQFVNASRADTSH